MNIYLTFDYELFLGKETGDAESCLIRPTDELLRIARAIGKKMIFFVDSGYLLKLEEYKARNPLAARDYSIVMRQLETLRKEGHSLQLHIHPHWEDSYYAGDKWVLKTERYRLHDFSEKEIEEIVFRYKKVLTDIVGDHIFAFRAGGWCLQPFAKIKAALKKNDIWLDSSVFPGGRSLSDTHYFDYQGAPSATMWKFDDDPLIENPDGYFAELPIASCRYGPDFYWRFAFQKLRPSARHKMFGNGAPIGSSKKDVARMLTTFTTNPVSCDGYKSSVLGKAYRLQKRREPDGNFVIIGHTKAQSLFSLEKLKSFILALDDGDDVVDFSRLGE